MGAGEDVGPTPSQTEEMRNRLRSHIAENGGDLFDQRDVDRFNSSQRYVDRFFKHVDSVASSAEEQIELAMNIVIQCFKFRKETRMADLKHTELLDEHKERGTLFYHGRDKDGKRMLIFRVRTHTKSKDQMEDMKKFVLYQVERLEREEDGDPVTLMFELDGCGLKNMDMEFIQYLIGVFRDYSPFSLNYILVYEMPWVLNAAWKVIKGWLPAAGVKKIKFVAKATVGEFVRAEDRLTEWGGDFAYDPSKFDPGPGPAAPAEINGNVEDAKSAAAEDTVSLASTIMASPPDNNAGGLLRLGPSANDIVFDKNGYGDLVARLTIANSSERPAVYKIKTTSPDKYKVRPSMYCLGAGSTNVVEIAAQSTTAAALVRDKFLITAVAVEQEGVPATKIAEIMKTAKPESQYRLRCQLAASAAAAQEAPVRGTVVANGEAAKVHPELARAQTLDNIAKKVSSLTSAVEDLHAQIASMKIFIFVLISLVFAILAVLVYNAYNVTAADANPAMVAVEDMCATASTPAAAAHQHVTATGEL